MNPKDQSRAAFRGTIAVGRRYRLRNGATVTITASKVYTWGIEPGVVGRVDGWLGEVDGSRQKMTWQKNGWYAPEVGVRPHPLDILGPAR